MKNTVNFKIADVKVKAAITAYGKTAASKLEAEAKKDAPWTDRTSNARNSLQGKFITRPGVSRISLSGNMSYSPWLELANEKKYAILKPTMFKYGYEIVKGYQRIVNSL